MVSNVILDVDTGSDDALAILVLLIKVISNPIKVLAITCTHGNTDVDNVARNVLLVLESVNQTQIPVYKGAREPILGASKNKLKWHGEDGFGDQQFADPTTAVQEESAVSAIYRLAAQHKDVNFISVGPLTNLALAVKVYPDLTDKLGHVWIMGGNINGVGNVASTTAEFNFHSDPEAAFIVFHKFSGRITLLPWEPCMKPDITSDWRFSEMGNSSSKHMEIMNKVETSLYSRQTYYNPCDAFLAAVFVNASAAKSFQEMSLSIELSGTYTRGQCVFLREEGPKIRVVQELDFNVIKDVFMEVGRHQVD